MSIPPLTVSVVISCFNYERYVGPCIRSALEQTVPALEVIVVNDGSTDGSAAVLAGFGDRIAVIEQQNSGQVAALYRGFAISRGDVVLFLDADDLLHPRALEEVIRAWRPRCTKVQFELELIDGDGVRLGRRFCNYVEPYGSREVREEFAAFGTYVWPVTSGNAYSRWFLEQVLPVKATPRATPSLDGILNTLAPLYGDVEVVPRTLAWYRLHALNQSYHGTNADSIGRRFARQVEIRSKEIRLLAEHAAASGRALPPGTILDWELPFVNYRMMLKRLGENYEGAAADTPAGLWSAGALVLARRPLPMRLKLAHAAWLTALLCSPRWICRRLILLRFSRAALLQPIRHRLACMPWGSRRREAASRKPV